MFTCKGSEPYEQWSNKRVGRNDFEQLTLGREIRPGPTYEAYRLHKDNGFFNLEVIEEDVSYAGVYECKYVGAVNDARYAQLTLLGRYFQLFA